MQQNALLASVSEDIGKGHAELLMGQVQSSLEFARLTLSQIDRFVVSLGPGSFAGVRVGIAAARGFGLSLGKPVIGVTTLEACVGYARKIKPGDEPLISLLDARRNEVYVQFPNEAPCLMSSEVAAVSVAENEFSCCGSAAPDILALAKTGNTMVHDAGVFPIDIYAQIAASRTSIADTMPEPVYLRNADAKRQSGFAVERA